MTNYENKTDTEINQLVCISLYSLKGWGLSGDGKEFYHCDFDGNGNHRVGVEDFCNDWGVGGPIIAENNISLDQSNEECMAHAGPYLTAEHVTECGYKYEAWHSNPLRAAMIVYLMMKEGEG